MARISRNSGDLPVHTITLSTAESTSSLASEDAPVPPPAAYYSTSQAQADQIADFFGASRKSHTPPPKSPKSVDGATQLPKSEPKSEPLTLARCMFFYGFMFPPFWVMGIIILTSKLRPTEDWELGKTEDEKTRLLAEMRIVEVKWAKRCIYALLTLFTIILVIVLAVVFGKR